jgi:hypothetical protein
MKTPLHVRNISPKITEKEFSEESDSSSHGSKPQLAPAHEWSDDCVSEKTEEEEP